MKTSVKTLALALSLLSPFASLSTYALPQGSELKAGAAVWNLFDDADRYALHVAYVHKPLESFYGIRPTVLLVNADQGQHYSLRGWQKMSTNTMTFQYALPFTRALLMNLKI